MTAITAATVQSTLGAQWLACHPAADGARPIASRPALRQGTDAIKTGMRGDAAMVENRGRVFARSRGRDSAGADPVMVAQGGAKIAGR